MDEEDMAEAEEARTLQTTEAFAGLGASANPRPQDGSIMEIFRSSGETMGAKLLKKMGWREGQGVGPKVRRRARVDGTQDIQDGAGQEMHLFAPENSGMISFIRKIDRKGLGFEGEERIEDHMTTQSQLESQSAEVKHEGRDSGSASLIDGSRGQKKKPERKGGFGVGILNDNGSDDENPYAMGPQISYNRTVGGDKKKKKKSDLGRPSANPLLTNKPIFVSKRANTAKPDSSSGRCHDGRLPLDGFVLSSRQDFSLLSQDGIYPPPSIPEGWKPSRGQTTSTPSGNGAPHYVSPKSVAAASKLSPKSRAALLGEALLPGKSVFDFLTPGARSRIASATNNENLPPALGEGMAQHPVQPKTLHSLIPPLARETAQTALGRGTTGWMPYAEDLAKRARYRTFLGIRAGLRADDTLPDRVPGASNDDWVNEMKEFAHAAQIFKPMTGAMATRFISSVSAPQLASDNLKQGNMAGSTGETSLLTTPTGKAKTPAEEAAAVGMYGPLTRSIENFHPSRLLCKRFNVQPPTHVQVDAERALTASDTSGTASGPPRAQTQSTALPRRSLELVGKKDMADLRMTGRMGILDNDPGVEKPAGEESKAASGQGIDQSTVIDPERNEALEKERPGEAVFKAIFGSDSEDD